MIQAALRNSRALSRGLGVSYPLLLLLALFGCGESVQRTPITRVASPTGDLDAVLVRSNAGATTGFVFSVHIVRESGTPGAPADAVIGFDRTDDVDLEWIDENRLRIRLTGGRILHRRAYWYRRGSPDVPRVEVSIVHEAQDMPGSSPPERRKSD